MLVANSTLGGEIHLTKSENLTLTNILYEMTNLTEEEYDIKTNYNVTSLKIDTTDGLGNYYADEFKITAKIKVNMSDPYISLSPSEFQTIVSVNFNGIYDPYYSIEESDKIEVEYIIVIGKNDNHLQGLEFDEFLRKINFIQYIRGVSMLDRVQGKNDTSKIGLIRFLNGSSDIGDYSYVDSLYLNKSIFSECEDLYYDTQNRFGDYFQLDSITFAAMKGRYDLDTTGWETEC
jgi:hypothetical protein